MPRGLTKPIDPSNSTIDGDYFVIAEDNAPILEGEEAIQEAIAMAGQENISLTKAALRIGLVLLTVT